MKDDYEVEIFEGIILPFKKKHSDNFNEETLDNFYFIEASKECFRLSENLLKKKGCDKILICANREERYLYMDNIKIIKRLNKECIFENAIKIKEKCKKIIYRYPYLLEKFDNLIDILDYFYKHTHKYLKNNLKLYIFDKDFKILNNLIHQKYIKTLDDLIKKDKDKFQDFLFVPTNA
uniref:Uncharacterized protein n=1 Tax=viral metagenome TaxID=1070528 RepID=A0A6C0AG53_9ZZZZ